MLIGEIMNPRVVAVGAAEPVTAAARLLKRHNVGALPVTDKEGRLRGMVTDRDIVLRCVAAEADPAETKVSEIMSRGIICAACSDDVKAAAGAMAKDQIRRLPVTDNGRLIGIVTLCDLARDARTEMEAAAALGEISANVRRK